MTKPGYSLRLDPWAPEYGGSIQADDEQAAPEVDIAVEAVAWEAIRPAPAPRAAGIAFVDGVRRIEHRLLVGQGERTIFGLLGSFGVGAVVADEAARVVHPSIGRVAVTGGGLKIDPFVALVGRSGAHVVFEPRSEAENTFAAPLDGLQKAMREREAGLAERLSAEAQVVFQDGPLGFLTAAAPGRVVGFVKTLQRQYLDAGAQGLLVRLGVGERTPLFLIPGREPRYSWYLRIAFGRAIESPLTGIARLEVAASHGVAGARALADLSAREIPRFASDGTRDPRAPQNLHPIGGLEARLKHLLGDPLVVRRAVEASIHREVSA
jgi:hypothetical protein